MIDKYLVTEMKFTQKNLSRAPGKGGLMTYAYNVNNDVIFSCVKHVNGNRENGLFTAIFKQNRPIIHELRRIDERWIRKSR